MNKKEVHLKLSDVKIDNDNLDYIKMTGEICGKLRDDLVELFSTPDVVCSPILAKIEHINDLCKSNWYEVVYYDDKWYSYSGSKTFEDGERVVKWKYAKDCI